MGSRSRSLRPQAPKTAMLPNRGGLLFVVTWERILLSVETRPESVVRYVQRSLPVAQLAIHTRSGGKQQKLLVASFFRATCDDQATSCHYPGRARPRCRAVPRTTRVTGVSKVSLGLVCTVQYKGAA